MKKIKYFFFIIVFIGLLSPNVFCLQQVIDTTNLVQNIQQTLKTVRIESVAMQRLAMKAKQLGNDVQKILTLKNQLMVAKMNIENVARLIKSGKYKSIQELNNMCYAVQRIGYSVNSIEASVKRIFPESYALYKSEKEKQKLILAQEQEIDSAVKDALKTQAAALGEESNTSMTQDIDAILTRSSAVAGMKGAIQLQTEMISLLIRQNRELKNLIATNARVNAIEAGRDSSLEKKKRDEHKNFMKDFGKADTPKKSLTAFP